MASRAKATSRRSGLICPPRFATPRNPDRETLGPGIAKVAELLGTPLMPWQRLVADVMGEIDPATGDLWYTEGDISAMRQVGKTQLGMAFKTHRCTRFGGRQVVAYYAQDRNKAHEKLVEEHIRILRESPAFAGHFTARLSNGSEHIKWANGSHWGIDAPTRTSGHSKVLDYVEIDEAFAHADNEIEIGVGPAMITRRSKQLVVMSAAGDARSRYWYAKVVQGRKACETGKHGRTAYFEWSAPDDADPGDPATWRAAVPALGHTITEQALEAEYLKALRQGQDALDLFRRSYLNQWPEVPLLDDAPTGWQKIPKAWWEACTDQMSTIPEGSRVAFAVDMTPDRKWSSIGVCGVRGDGLEHLELVDHEAGSDWVVARVGELIERWPAVSVALDKAGPAGSLWDDLEKTLPTDMLVAPTAGEHARAAGSLFDALEVRSVRHRSRRELTAAAEAARERKLGEAWAWTRAGATTPISPLVAVTLARWALRRAPALSDAVQVW